VFRYGGWNGGYGMLYLNGVAPAIRHCKISKFSYIGIYAFGTTSTQYLYDNMIENDGNAVGLYVNGARPVNIQDNEIHNCQTGLQLAASGGNISGIVASNSVLNCTYYGIRLIPSGPVLDVVISNNNICGNLPWNLYVQQSTPSTDAIEAINNWWGLGDSASIAAKVYDHNDNSSCPYVSFMPFSQNQNGQLCPSDFNYSGRVDGVDLVIFAQAFGSDTLDSDWNRVCDLDSSWRIDGFDLAIFSTQFGSLGDCLNRILRPCNPSESLITVIAEYPSYEVGNKEEYSITFSIESPISTNGLAFEFGYDTLTTSYQGIEKLGYYGSSKDSILEVALAKEAGIGQVCGGIARLSGDGLGKSGSGDLFKVRFKAKHSGRARELSNLHMRCIDPSGFGWYDIKYQQKYSGELLPQDYFLAQNYPNPFNSNTNIRLAIPKSGQVNLTVFNIQGQLVRTIIDGELQAGYHMFTWDGRSDAGELVGSGLYYYLFRSSDYKSTKKMVLVK